MSTSELNDHILEKLRQTIDTWSGEVTGAHDSLNRQIMETRAELTRLMTLIRKQSGDPAAADPDTIVKLALLQEELDELKEKRKQERRDSQQLRLDYAVIQNKLHMATVTLESVLSENEALKAAGDDVATLKNTISAVADAHEASQDRHDALDEHDAEGQTRVDELQRDLDALRAEYKSLTEKHTSLATDHERTMAELDASRSEFTVVERRSHQLNEDQEALQLQVKRLQDRIVEKEKEIARLQSSLDETAQSSDAAELREENVALRGELETLRESFQKQAETLEEHIRSIQSFQEREAEFTEREDALRHEIASLKARLEQPAESASLVERERSLDEKELHLHEATQWVKDIESAALTVQQNLDSLRESMLARAAQKEAAAAAESQEIAALRREIDARIAGTAAVAKGYQATIADLRAQLNTQDQQDSEAVAALRHEIDARIAGTAAVAKGYQATIADLRAQLNTKDQQDSEAVAALRKEIDARIAGTAAVAKASQERIRNLEADLEAQRNLNTDQSAQIEALQAELSEREHIARSSAETDARTQELQKAQALIAELEAKLESRNAELDGTHKLSEGELDDVVSPSPFDAFDESGQQRAIGEILLEADIITETQLFNALVEQDKMPNRRIGSILLEQGLIHEDTVAKVLASQLRLDYVDLDGAEFQSDALAMLNGRSATRHMSIPLRIDGDVLVVAMANPLDQMALEELERTTGKRIETVVAPLSDITAAIVRNYSTDFRDESHPAPREESLQSADE